MWLVERRGILFSNVLVGLIVYEYIYVTKDVSPQPWASRTTMDKKSTSDCRGRHNLKKLLVAFMFNQPHYDVIPALKRYYQNIFGKVVFCGRGKHKDVILLNNYHGFNGYMCVAKAIQFVSWLPWIYAYK